MKRVSIVLVSIFLASGFVAGGEGRIPIWETTLITQNGKYILTRDVGSDANEPAIRVESGVEDVDIDLNGFTVHGFEGASNVGIIQAEQVENFAVRNGFIWSRGGDPEAGVYVNGAGSVIVEDLTIRNTGGPGIDVENVGVVTIRRNVVMNATSESINVQGGPPGVGGTQVTGVIEDNSTWNGDDNIYVRRAAGLVIRNNSASATYDFGIWIDDCRGCLIVENRIAGSRSGISTSPSSEACEIRSNVVTEAREHGILVQGVGHRVAGNIVRRCDGDGVRIEGQEILVERNQLYSNGQTGPGWGLHFTSTSDRSYFGRNVGRSNSGAGCASGTSDFCDESTTNVSFGDNYLPTNL